MNKTVLVTCMFNNTYSTPLGGRNRETMYKESLPCIAKMPVDIICFTSTEEYHGICEFVQDNCLTNVTVLTYDLTAQDYHSRIMQVKDSDPATYYDELFWQTRCPHIMWGKTRMLSHVIANYDYNQLFWIDAGLSASSFMWEKYFPLIDTHQKYYYSEGMFTETFLNSLKYLGKQKIFGILHTRPNNMPIAAEFNSRPYDDYSAMIGGLFGGPRHHMQWFCSHFEDYVNRVLDKNMLISEESIYSGIHNDFKDSFNTLRFDTFYNEDWGDIYNPNTISFATILQKLIDGHYEH